MMKLTMPAATFGSMASKVLKFKGRGSDVHTSYGLALVEHTEKGLSRISAGNPSGGAKVGEKSDGEPGATCILLDHLDKVTSILPSSGKMIFEVHGSRVHVSAGAVSLEFPALPAEDFIHLPSPPKDGWFDVSSKSVSGVVDHVRWAMSEDGNQSNLSSIHLTHDFSEATDTRKLAQLRPGIVPEGVDIVVPSEVWLNIKPFVEKSRVKMCVNGSSVWMRGGNWAICNRVLSEKYVDTSGIVFDPDDDNIHAMRQFKLRIHWIYVNRQEVLNAVRRIQSAAVNTEERKFGAGVRFELVDGELHLISHYPIEDMSNSIHVDEKIDWGEGSVMEDDGSAFDGLKNLSLYSLYMNKALSALSSDLIKIMWAVVGESRIRAPVQFHDEKIGAALAVSPRLITTAQE